MSLVSPRGPRFHGIGSLSEECIVGPVRTQEREANKAGRVQGGRVRDEIYRRQMVRPTRAVPYSKIISRVECSTSVARD